MKQKWIKSIARALVPCFVFFVFSFSFAPKAHAAEFTGSITYGYYSYNTSNSSFSSYMTTNGTLPLTNVTLSGNNYYSVGPGYFDFYCNTYPEQTFGSNVKLYASYYVIMYRANANNPVSNITMPSNYLDKTKWQVSYVNSYGQTGYVENGLSKFTDFTAPSNNALFGKGFALEAEWQADDIYPIRSLIVKRTNGYGFKNSGSQPFYAGFVIPSLRIITTESTPEMEQLDKVADVLIEQNDILLAMKGDIVAILQDIYQNTGDIETAANLMNSYLSTMVTHLNNIKNNTANINTKLGSIYTYMGTMLSALETAISLNADTIEAAIAAQTAAMIAYFEQYFNTGNEVPDDTYQQQQDASNILDQMESLEKPNVDTIVPEIGDYTDNGVSGVLSAIFSSNLIVTMMTLSASFAFGAYVLFGKRE